MQVKVFDTVFDAGVVKLNEFLAQDGVTITVDRIFTAACQSVYSTHHYITVVYRKFETAPDGLGPGVREE
jgi:hypothetical protein